MTIPISQSHLISEWDFAKNVEFDPSLIRTGSGKKLWWLCSNLHSWRAAPCNRTSRGCPDCHLGLKKGDKRSFAEKYPKKLTWYGKDNALDPNKIYFNSERTADWNCSANHTLSKSFKQISALKSLTCTKCNLIKIRLGKSTLVRFDEEKNLINEEEAIAGSKRNVFWFSCPEEHSWEGNIEQIYSLAKECPICAMKVSSLEYTHPKLLQYWDYATNPNPHTIKFRERKIYNFKNKHCHHHWTRNLRNQNNDNNCAICSHRVIIIGTNDVLTRFPQLALAYNHSKNRLKIEELSLNTLVDLTCPLGHKWNSKIATFVKLKTPCPYCDNRQCLRGFNDLATTHPELLRQWDFEINEESPFHILSDFTTNYMWKCKEGHSWPQSINHRLASKNSCPVCLKKRLQVGQNDLQSTHPELINEWDFARNLLRPSQVTSGSKKSAAWICSNCGYSFRQIIAEFVRHHGCSSCKGTRVNPGFNDLETLYPGTAQYLIIRNGVAANQLLPTNCKPYCWSCSRCGGRYERAVRDNLSNSLCSNCRQYSSTGERELVLALKRLFPTLELIQNNRKLIHPYELDILIPSKRMAIEYNGQYWHGEKKIRQRMGMGAAEYHGRKVDLCRKQGYLLLFVWEKDWLESSKLICEALRESIDTENSHPLLSKLL